MSKADGLADLASDADSSISWRNKIINGAFDIWQRATTFALASTTVTYTADRWCAVRGATGSTISRVAGSVARYGLKVARDSSNASTVAIKLSQVFETCEAIPLAGKTVTLTANIKAGADFSAVSLGVVLRTGTGTDQGMTTGGVFTTGDAATLNTTQVITTTSTRYSFTVDIPAGKTGIAVQFVHTPVGTAGADDSFTVENVQLEIGAADTAFERRHIAAELALCKRYYEVGKFGQTAVGVSSGNNVGHQSFMVEKRTTPVIAISGLANTSTSGTTATATDERSFFHFALWSVSAQGTYTGTYAANAEL